MKDMLIGELARQVRIRPSAVRYYEQVGIVPAPQRINGRRRYDERALQRLRLIQLAQSAGFTIAEIKTLINGFVADTPPSERWRPLVEHKLYDVAALIERARIMQARLVELSQCACASFEECAETGAY